MSNENIIRLRPSIKIILPPEPEPEPQLQDVGTIYKSNALYTDRIATSNGVYMIPNVYSYSSAPLLFAKNLSWSFDCKISYKSGSKNQWISVYHNKGNVVSGHFGIGSSLSNGKLCVYTNAGSKPQWTYNGTLSNGQNIWLRIVHIANASNTVLSYSFDGSSYNTAYTDSNYGTCAGVANFQIHTSDGNPIDLRDVLIIVDGEVYFRRV